jgi:hypothetical protein
VELIMVYLVNKETNEVINVFTDAIEWDEQSVLYRAGKGIGKIYAIENEYFTDVNPEPMTEEVQEEVGE